jgi:site-specific recombinase XerD
MEDITPVEETPRGWVLTENRFLTHDQVQALRTCARPKAEGPGWRRRSHVHEWITVEVALLAGLRVSEIAALQCGDVWPRPEGGSLIVRRGKGGKARLVKFGGELSQALRRYLAWKGRRSEPLGQRDPLILSAHTGRAMTTRALQKMFARVATRAGVSGHRFHDLRHTYASYLYRSSGNNLRLVQKQLGHASVRTTEIYADVLDGEAEKAVNALYA